MLPENAKCSMTKRYMTSLTDTKHFSHLILQLLRPRAVSRLFDEIIKSLRSEQITVLHLQRAQPEVGEDPSLETFSKSSSGECESIDTQRCSN